MYLSSLNNGIFHSAVFEPSISSCSTHSLIILAYDILKLLSYSEKKRMGAYSNPKSKLLIRKNLDKSKPGFHVDRPPQETKNV